MIINCHTPGHENLIVVDALTPKPVGMVKEIDLAARCMTRLVPIDESVPPKLRRIADYLEVKQSLNGYYIKFHNYRGESG
jgi:hypothetical protein